MLQRIKRWHRDRKLTRESDAKMTAIFGPDWKSSHKAIAKWEQRETDRVVAYTKQNPIKVMRLIQEDNNVQLEFRVNPDSYSQGRTNIYGRHIVNDNADIPF